MRKDLLKFIEAYATVNKLAVVKTLDSFYNDNREATTPAGVDHTHTMFTEEALQCVKAALEHDYVIEFVVKENFAAIKFWSLDDSQWDSIYILCSNSDDNTEEAEIWANAVVTKEM